MIRRRLFIKFFSPSSFLSLLCSLCAPPPPLCSSLIAPVSFICFIPAFFISTSLWLLTFNLYLFPPYFPSPCFSFCHFFPLGLFSSNRRRWTLGRKCLLCLVAWPTTPTWRREPRSTRRPRASVRRRNPPRYNHSPFYLKIKHPADK